MLKRESESIRFIRIDTGAFAVVLHAYEEIYIGAVLDEKTDNVGVALGHGNIHGTLARRGDRVGIAAAVEKRLDERIVALKTSVVEQREVAHERVLELASRARTLDQVERNVRVVLVDGREESRAAGLVARVHVRARAHQLHDQVHDALALNQRRHGQPDALDQCRVAVVVRDVRVGAASQQIVHYAQVVVGDRDRQWREP